ncbi:MAG: hypothetical protein GSR72_00785 [Desulfurococcales archaeon]|nr:hypothetical protein [Desulfurococcales archaeon]
MSRSSSDILICIDSNASKYGIKAYYMTSEGPSSPRYPANWENIIRELHEYIVNKYTVEDLKNDPIIKAYRKFYWRIGIDPTKTRPSSEALVRRLLRGRFPKISPIVDAGNIASAKYLVPIGLYDLEKASVPLRLTVSRGGEIFYGIGGKDEVLEEGLPILVDSVGNVLHLYPHRDSRITMIRDTTTKLLALAAGVPGVSDDLLVETLRFLGGLLDLLKWKTSDIIRVEGCLH